MRGDSDIWWIADDFVGYFPLAVCVALWEIQRAGDNSDGRIARGETSAEILKVRPVISIEPFSHLRTHVRQVKRIIHGFLAPFRIRCRNLVSSVIARPEVVLQLAAELFWNGGIFEEYAVFAIAVRGSEGSGRDVLCNPAGVPQAAVKGGDE